MEERIKTRDIKRTLEEYAEKLQVPVQELDFEILSSELVGPENGRFFLETEISITLKVPGVITIFDCLVDIDDRERESYAYLKVLPTFRMQLSKNQLEKAEGKIELTPTQKEELIKETRKLLYMEGVIYGILPEEKIIDDWGKAIHFVYKVKKPYSFKVAEGKPPKEPYRREIYYIPLITPAGKIINERTGRIDFKDRGYTDKKISKGSKVATIEYTPGEIGIKVTGEIIPYSDIPPLPFEVDRETLEIREIHKTDKIIYEIIALQDGYLYIENGKMGLSEYVKEKVVDYTTGNIVFKDTGVNLEVTGKGDSVFHDAVKDDFKIISPGKSVIIKGNVGRKAVIEASEVIIEGMVAKDAVIKADICKIKAVTGAKVEAKKAFIERAVNATIVSEEAFAHTVSGTTIRAKRIVALKALRYSNLYAYDFICVEEARDFNKLITEPEEVPAIKREIANLQGTIGQEELKIKSLLGQIKKLEGRINGCINLIVSYMKPVLKENAAKLRPILKNLLNNTEKLKETLEKLPTFTKSTAEELLKRKEELDNLSASIEDLKEKVKKLQERINAIRERTGIILVLGTMSQDNLIQIKKAKRYYNSTLRGPILFYEEEGTLLDTKEWDDIASKLTQHLDSEYIDLFRDYLLEKGLRTYVTRLKI